MDMAVESEQEAILQAIDKCLNPRDDPDERLKETIMRAINKELMLEEETHMQVKAGKLRECEMMLQAILKWQTVWDTKDKRSTFSDTRDEVKIAVLEKIVGHLFTMVEGQHALRDDERILQVINRCTMSRDDEYYRNKGIVEEILQDVFATMIVRDTLFRQLYRNFFFVENYYKGMKVCGEGEFHVNISLVIPLKYNLIGLPKGQPGYKMLRLPNKTSIYTPEWDKYRSVLSPWLTEETSGQFLYIDKDAVLRSMESLLERAMLNVPKIDNYTVKVCKNGSPITLRVNKQGFPQMNVSLVPVINMSELELHSQKENNWYAVPDILQNVKDEHLQWRLAFYDHEDNLLGEHSYIKPVIRLIEKLRHIKGWKVIPCYHIKTLFLHHAINVGHYRFFAKFTGIKLFIHILSELRNVCKSRDLKNCWDPAHNLVDADVSQLADIAEQLTVIIGEITDDPAKLSNWVLTSEEMDMYQDELNAIGNIKVNDN